MTRSGFDLFSQFRSNDMSGKVVGKGKRFVQTGSNDGYYLCDSDAPVLVYTGDDITFEEAEALMKTRKQEFAQKSNKLLMKDWLARGYIYENWNAVTGQGDDVGNSDRFYHWGSLLGYINLMED